MPGTQLGQGGLGPMFMTETPVGRPIHGGAKRHAHPQ